MKSIKYRLFSSLIAVVAVVFAAIGMSYTSIALCLVALIVKEISDD